MKTSSDALIIGGVELHSRLFIGTENTVRTA